MPDKLLTIKEAAERIGRSPGALRFQISQGRGPKTGKLGGRVLVRESDLEAWIASAFADDEREPVGA